MYTDTGMIQGTALTDIGLRRAVNEDSVLSARSIFAVADGMGGHEAGDLASQLCIKTLAEIAVDGTADTRLPHAHEVLTQVERADAAIRRAIASRGGTTLCALALVSAEPGGGTWPEPDQQTATTLTLPVQPGSTGAGAGHHTGHGATTVGAAASADASAPAAPGHAHGREDDDVAVPRYLEGTQEAHVGSENPRTDGLSSPLSEADPTTDVLPYVPAAPDVPSGAVSDAVTLLEHPGAAGVLPAESTDSSAPPALQLMLLNVGDSRGYRLRAGILTQLTLDHSAVQELIDSGTITEAEARIHPQRNLITRALGAGGNSVPDAQFHALVPGDRYLLCSDGLTGEVEHASIERILNDFSDRTEAATGLIAAALASGGRDNISVVIIDVIA